jgi:hypothetical protein
MTHFAPALLIIREMVEGDNNEKGSSADYTDKKSKRQGDKGKEFTRPALSTLLLALSSFRSA